MKVEPHKSPLFEAISKHDHLRVADLISRGEADPNERDGDGMPAITFACKMAARQQHEDIKCGDALAAFEVLLAAGADIEALDSFGHAPLLFAHGECVLALLEAGANPSPARPPILDKAGRGKKSGMPWPPIIWAVSSNDIPLANALIAAGCNINETIANRVYIEVNAVMDAVVGNKPEMLLLLLEAGGEQKVRGRKMTAKKIAQENITGECLAVIEAFELRESLAARAPTKKSSSLRV